jgi:hypothetical protein
VIYNIIFWRHPEHANKMVVITSMLFARDLQMIPRTFNTEYFAGDPSCKKRTQDDSYSTRASDKPTPLPLIARELLLDKST